MEKIARETKWPKKRGSSEAGAGAGAEIGTRIEPETETGAVTGDGIRTDAVTTIGVTEVGVEAKIEREAAAVSAT